MNIILINHYAGSPDLGMEFRPYYMARKWQEASHNVSIIAGSYSHVRQHQPKKLGWQNVEGVNYLWLWTNKYIGNGVKRFIGMIVFIFQILIRIPSLAIKLKPDVVIASSTYPLDIFPAYLLAKLTRATLVFEIHDLWPLSPIEIGGMSKWHPFIIIMRFGEWFAYKLSDKIVSIPPFTYKHVKKDGVPKSKFKHIPNGIYLEESAFVQPIPTELSQHIEQARKSNKLIIGYAGALGIANHIINLIKAAAILENKGKIVCIIVGDGQEKHNLVNYVKSHNISNVIFSSRIPKRCVNDFLSNVDVLYVGGKKSKLYSEFGLSHNKTYDYMFAAKPIIESLELANKPTVEANCGFSIPADDPQALADTINKILKMPKNALKKLGENGRSYVVSHHDYNILAKQFLDFIL